MIQVKIFGNLRKKRSGTVENCRTAEAGMKFFSNRDASHYLAALKHERLETGLGEIESSDEAVVAGANNDDSVLECAGRVPTSRERRFGSGQLISELSGVSR